MSSNEINELIRITLRFPALAAVKTMLKWQRFDCGGCLTPRENLTESGQLRLREQLQKSTFHRALSGARSPS